MSEHDTGSVNPPVGHGHKPPFTGDIQLIWHCGGVVLEKIRAQDFLNKELHQHLAQGYGEAATAFLKSGPPPVGVLGATPQLDTLEDCRTALEGLLEAETDGTAAAVDTANVNYLMWLSLFLRIAELIRDELSK